MSYDTLIMEVAVRKDADGRSERIQTGMVQIDKIQTEKIKTEDSITDAQRIA